MEITEITAKDIEITNPVNLQKIEKAAEILSYTGNGMGIKEACEKAGVDYRSHLNWVKQGIYVLLVGDRVRELQQVAADRVVNAWPQIVDNIVEVALDKDKKAYPRDVLAAALFLKEHYINPAEATMPAGTSEEAEYLETVKNGKANWSPRLKQVTFTYEEEGDPVIDVTPKEES